MKELELHKLEDDKLKQLQNMKMIENQERLNTKSRLKEREDLILKRYANKGKDYNSDSPTTFLNPCPPSKVNQFCNYIHSSKPSPHAQGKIGKRGHESTGGHSFIETSTESTKNKLCIFEKIDNLERTPSPSRNLNNKSPFVQRIKDLNQPSQKPQEPAEHSQHKQAEKEEEGESETPQTENKAQTHINSASMRPTVCKSSLQEESFTSDLNSSNPCKVPHPPLQKTKKSFHAQLYHRHAKNKTVPSSISTSPLSNDDKLTIKRIKLNPSSATNQNSHNIHNIQNLIKHNKAHIISNLSNHNPSFNFNSGSITNKLNITAPVPPISPNSSLVTNKNSPKTNLLKEKIHFKNTIVHGKTGKQPFLNIETREDGNSIDSGAASIVPQPPQPKEPKEPSPFKPSNKKAHHQKYFSPVSDDQNANTMGLKVQISDFDDLESPQKVISPKLQQIINRENNNFHKPSQHKKPEDFSKKKEGENEKELEKMSKMDKENGGGREAKEKEKRNKRRKKKESDMVEYKNEIEMLLESPTVSNIPIQNNQVKEELKLVEIEMNDNLLNSEVTINMNEFKKFRSDERKLAELRLSQMDFEPTEEPESPHKTVESGPQIDHDEKHKVKQNERYLFKSNPNEKAPFLCNYF